MKKPMQKIIYSLLLAILVIIISTVVGSANIPFSQIPAIFSHKLFSNPLPAEIDSLLVDIFWKIRLPRALASFLVGGALAVSGTVMQSVLRNPLASSYTLGVSAGASLGVALYMAFGISLPIIGNFILPFIGFSFGLATVFIAIGLSSRFNPGLENQTIILTGMVISLFMNSLLTIIMSVFREHLQRVVFWQLGSFSGLKWIELGILTLSILPIVVILMRYTLELDIITFGEEHAISVGIDLKKTKLILITLATFLTGASVSFVGVIGFVDLIAPHIVRRIFGSSHRLVLPLSFVFGGTFMAFADIISRLIISPKELPIGSVTALIGAPFFIWVYFSKKRGVNA
ncbi:MAG TPA: iron ABC transporter permease [Clostridia bacterium]|nr:iron ABC transporter permease [Clostridia bacterium]